MLRKEADNERITTNNPENHVLTTRRYVIMNFDLEGNIVIIAAVITGLLFVFAVDWRYFRDWIVVFLFVGLLDFIWGSPVVKLNLIKYPVRLLPAVFQTSILF